MILTFTETRNAIQDARATIGSGDAMIRDIALLITGRLRQGRVDHVVLAALKKELREYNIQTRKWKE